MYSCYVHGWSSHHSMCPACQVVKTSTTTDTEINLAFENVSLEDKYAEAIKILDEMAKDLEYYSRHNHLLKTTAPNFAAETLDKYRKFKEGL